MSLLDEARRLAEIDPFLDTGYIGMVWSCAGCGTRDNQRKIHAADCPTLSMPRIVAALEAADRVIEGTNAYDNYGRMLVDMDDYDALVAALRGEVVPSNVRRIDTSGPLTPY